MTTGTFVLGSLNHAPTLCPVEFPQPVLSEVTIHSYFYHFWNINISFLIRRNMQTLLKKKANISSTVSVFLVIMSMDRIPLSTFVYFIHFAQFRALETH